MDKQTNRQTDTTKIMVTWPWTNQSLECHIVALSAVFRCNVKTTAPAKWSQQFFKAGYEFNNDGMQTEFTRRLASELETAAVGDLARITKKVRDFLSFRL